MTSNKSLFQVIDLDRTLFDTSKFAKLITDEVNKLHPGVGSDLDQKFEDAYKNDTTFFMLRHLREEMGDTAFEQMVQEVVMREGVDSLLMPGAKERLLFAHEVSDSLPAWGILTYGDEIDQLMKLQLVGLQEAPTLILSTPNKSEAIHTWQNDDGTFTLPAVFGGATVDSITLEDDKLRAFIGMPENVTGIWMVNTQNKDQLRSESLPSNVKPVDSLYESIQYLRSLYL